MAGTPLATKPPMIDPSDPEAPVTAQVITIKISLEDGAPLISTPMITPQQDVQTVCSLRGAFGDGTVRLQISKYEGLRLQNYCPVRVSLAGYRAFVGNVREGQTIVLRRLGPHESSTTSVKSRSAPTDAKNAYDMGEVAAAKHRWPEAERRFREAVSSYPQYPEAWSELGRSLEAEGKLDEARAALEKACATDSKYVKPVVQLAGIASQQHRWEEERRLAEQAMGLDAVEFPSAYFYCGEAAYHEGRMDEAERLVREALNMDGAREAPEALFLLAMIFVDRGETDFAVTQLREYLRVAPHGENVVSAKRELGRLRGKND